MRRGLFSSPRAGVVARTSRFGSWRDQRDVPMTAVVAIARHELAPPALGDERSACYDAPMRVLATLLFSLLAACGQADPAAEAAEGPPAAPPATAVVAAEVRSGPLETTWTLRGDVRAVSDAQLAAGAAGRVTAVRARVGERVRRGQVLVSLDARAARAEVRAARAEVEAAERDAARAREDAERNAAAGERAVSGAEIARSAAEADVAAATERQRAASVSRLRASLADYVVRAPFDGQVARRLVDRGDFVGSGAPLIEIVGAGATEILVHAQPEILAHVALGSVARMSHGEEGVEAEVTGLVQALDPATRAVTIRLALRGEAPWALPGASVSVAFTIVRDEGVIVPGDALVLGARGHRVVLVVDGKAAPRSVRVVARTEGEALVVGEGVSAGALVVTRGNERLRPEQPVRVAEGS